MKIKNLCILFLFITISIIVIGCSSGKGPSSVINKIVNTPNVYIETLKHPTEFPEEYLPEVMDIDKMLEQNKLGEDEIVKILMIGESKLSSSHFVQVRKDSEIKPHFHKKHDKTISVKKGKGIAILNGTRYLIRPGTVIQVPSKTRYQFINTGDDVFVGLSVFTPPFDGKDITYVKEEVRDIPVSEAQKEKEKLEKKKKNKLVVKDENIDKDAEELKKQKQLEELEKKKKIIKITDTKKEYEDYNNEYIRQDRLATPHQQQNFEKEEIPRAPVAKRNNIDKLNTNNSDDDLEYEYDLHDKIDDEESQSIATDDELSNYELETLTDETISKNNSDSNIFDRFEDEEEPGGFVYENDDLIDRANKEKRSEGSNYIRDDPFEEDYESFEELESDEF